MTEQRVQITEEGFYLFVDWLKNRDVNKAPWRTPYGTQFRTIDFFSVETSPHGLIMVVRGS